MSVLRKTLFASIISILISSSANAVLVDNGDFLTDTTNGIDWFDVSLTVNRSYNDVFSQLGTGGEFEGWRYATSSEVNSLRFQILDSGNNLYDWQSLGLTGIDDVNRLSPDGEGDYVYGLLHSEPCADPLGLNCAYDVVHYLQWVDGWHSGGYLVDTSIFLEAALNEQYSNRGHYLVRDTSYVLPELASVPEPASFMLMGLGLLGIGLVRRRKSAV